jgi:hypothetical protein
LLGQLFFVILCLRLKRLFDAELSTERFCGVYGFLGQDFGRGGDGDGSSDEMS